MDSEFINTLALMLQDNLSVELRKNNEIRCQDRKLALNILRYFDISIFIIFPKSSLMSFDNSI